MGKASLIDQRHSMEGGGFAQKKGWMWLELQRPLRSARWVECWFVVDAGHLRFYDDAASRKAIGDIALSEAEVTKCPRVDYFAFRLEDLRRSRKYVLAAETEAESLNWAESLLEHGASGLLRALSVCDASTQTRCSMSKCAPCSKLVAHSTSELHVKRFHCCRQCG